MFYEREASLKLNRRKIFFIYRPLQIIMLKIILASCLLSLCSILAASILFYDYIKNVYESTQSFGALSLLNLLREYQSVYFLYILIGLIFSSALIVYSWLKMSHKIAGPLYHIRRNLKSYVEEENSEFIPIDLRKDDEMQDLAQLINSAILKNKKGFSIIEILVVVGLFAIIAFGVSSLLTNSMNLQKGIQAKDQSREVIAEIRTLLVNKSACYNSFGGRDPALGFSVTAIKDSSGVSQFIKGNSDKSKMLKFGDFVVSNYSSLSSVELKVQLSKASGIAGVQELNSNVIVLKVKRDGAGNISECYAIGNQSDGFWQASPLNISNIFYGGGNVGIMVPEPVERLEVGGNIVAAGNIDAHKVYSGGEIKVGSTGVGCSAAIEGQQRYDATSHTMQFCNGTAWVGMTGGGSGFVCVVMVQHYCNDGRAESISIRKSPTNISGVYPAGTYTGAVSSWCQDIVSCVTMN